MVRDTQYKMGVDAVVSDFEVGSLVQPAGTRMLLPLQVQAGVEEAAHQDEDSRGPDSIRHATWQARRDRHPSSRGAPRSYSLEVGFPFVFMKLVAGMEASRHVESEVKPEQWAPFFDNYLTG